MLSSRMLVTTLALTALPGCAAAGPRRPLADRVVPCPCAVGDLALLPAEHPRIAIDRDPDRATERYHPGARVSYRLFDPDTDPVAGNQCAYDASGSLIPSGPAAGTPDRVSPRRSLLGHWLLDVRPFRRLGWMEYHRRGWAPVSEPCSPGSG
ncbi:hypothetical protein [Tautonia sociabilis]|uniref:AMOP domain-containing protein n=1 Tax=Tautonia sociabilis TaxID=2080755 RepID=A0A432MKA3_9BACT|nr:hypothetical protein [Tautonia sociabilis]RUL87690.1 hypothetical protein TsocGM_10915 [Tautonia sociabilis]